MTSWRDDDGQEEKKPVSVVISDKRHSRDLEAEGEEQEAAAEPAAATAAQPAPPEAAEDAAVPEPPAEAPATPAGSSVLDFPGQHASTDSPKSPGHQDLLDAEHAFDHGSGGEQGDGSDLAPEMGDAEMMDFGGQGELSPEEQTAAAAEMAQLRQVFSGGLSRYLQAQLGLLLNFALIGLGRAPDPSTGLVAPNLNQARLAIDVLEFLVLRLEPDLHPQDREQLKQLVADLKYAFMQSVAGPGPAGGGPAGPAPGGLA